MFKPINTYLACGSIDSALSLIEINARDEIYRYMLEEMDEDTKFEFISEIDTNVCRMEDLDNEFDYMSVTRILEELCDIRTDDGYFNSVKCVSSDDMLELTNWTLDDISAYIRDNYDCMDAKDYSIEDILHTMHRLECKVKKLFAKYDVARKLFEMAAEQDIDALITTLWKGEA